MPGPTVLELVNRALQGLGLPQTATIVSAQDDQTGFQMQGLINELGTQLVKVHDWQNLERTQQYIGDGVTNSFPLPPDFGRMVNQTQWSSKNLGPMSGPISPQGWSWIQFGIISVGVTFRYRIIDNMFHVFPTPAIGEQLNFYYITKNWVRDSADVARDLVMADNDTVEFDAYLMICGIKLKMWTAKGLEAGELAQEFSYMLNTEKAQTQGAPVINLGSSRNSFLIGMENVREGSWNV